MMCTFTTPYSCTKYLLTQMKILNLPRHTRSPYPSNWLQGSIYDEHYSSFQLLLNTHAPQKTHLYNGKHICFFFCTKPAFSDLQEIRWSSTNKKRLIYCYILNISLQELLLLPQSNAQHMETQVCRKLTSHARSLTTKALQALWLYCEIYIS